MATLTIKELHKRFGTVEVLKGIDIEARDGDSNSVLGDGTNWDAIIPELFEPDPIPEPDHAQSIAKSQNQPAMFP